MEINNIFEHLYEELLEKKMIVFPSKLQIKKWDIILDTWIKDESMPLFARKSTTLRGEPIVNKRLIIKTDNSPAHWIVRKCILENKTPTIKDIKMEIQNKTFPLSMMIKRAEKKFLIPSQSLSLQMSLGNDGWKIAHIKRIALSRKSNLTLEQYKEHQYNFLSLSNIYLIKMEFSPIAEVQIFNDIILKSPLSA